MGVQGPDFGGLIWLGIAVGLTVGGVAFGLLWWVLR